MRHHVFVLGLALLGCPKPIDPPLELEAATTDACAGEACAAEVAPGPCTYDDECPKAEICDGGECLSQVSPAPRDLCGVPAIHFGRASARLSPNNQVRLAAALACLLEREVIELGACVDGSEAPELADLRARSVSGLLTSLGVAPERLRVGPCPTSGTSSSPRRVELRSPN